MDRLAIVRITFREFVFQFKWFPFTDAVKQAMEPIPHTIEINSITDKMNQTERYRFFGFDKSMDRPTESHNGTVCAKIDAVPQLETNLKKV